MAAGAHPGDDRPVRFPISVLTAFVALLAATAPAQAAWTGDVSGNAVHIRGDSASDLLQIGISGGFLSHSAAGPGYASATDWNSSPAITQSVPLAAQLKVVVEGGDG